MKKQILTLLALLPVAAAAQSGHFVLDGHFTGITKPTKAYLSYTSAGKAVIDSAVLENGNLYLRGDVTEPVKAQLILDHAGAGIKKAQKASDILPLYLEAGKISIKGPDSAKRSVINGSKLNAEYAAYSKLLAPHLQTVEKITAASIHATEAQKKDEQFVKKIEGEYNTAVAERDKLQIQFVKQHPGSFISLVIMQDMTQASMNLGVIEPLYNALAQQIKGSYSGVAFAKAIALEKSVSIGAVAPLFTQNDVNEKPVSLIDFRGKYVLVDFWASWCGPCRAENPNVVAAYNRYKNKNFTIIGVSMDAPFTKASWLAAIKKDGLEWIQVSDLKFTDNAVARLYGIKSIPQNVLLDPSGKVIGKNLRGEDLNNKLKEIFGL